MYDLKRGPTAQKKHESRLRARNQTPLREDAVAWVRRELGFSPDAQQAGVLAAGITRGMLNCTRQWGKSTIAAAKAIHQAYHVAESLTIMVSPSARQSGELVRKAEVFARRLGVKVTGDGANEISIALPNGSRIIGLPGTEATIRGFSAMSLLLVDEAARVSDELYMAIRPMLAVSGGALWLMSTPSRETRIFLRRMDANERGLATVPGSGDGVFTDFAKISGRGAGDDGGPAIPTGVSLRIRTNGEWSVRPGFSGGGDELRV